jgi:hypothetical protein
MAVAGLDLFDTEQVSQTRLPCYQAGKAWRYSLDSCDRQIPGAFDFDCWEVNMAEEVVIPVLLLRDQQKLKLVSDRYCPGRHIQ